MLRLSELMGLQNHVENREDRDARLARLTAPQIDRLIAVNAEDCLRRVDSMLNPCLSEVGVEFEVDLMVLNVSEIRALAAQRGR